MTATPTTDAEPAAGHIGSTPHGARNFLIGLFLVVMTGLLVKAYWPSEPGDSHVAGELSQFRQAMFNRCGGQEFAGLVSPRLAQAYAESDRMRVMVVKQFHQLQRSAANCSEVMSALRSVDYPIQ